ncbi:hypothetical protein K1719_032843 [Acacia pycnantha]|nr:hypothetical protein K1719_032843 [Acacia pycnantha]
MISNPSVLSPRLGRGTASWRNASNNLGDGIRVDVANPLCPKFWFEDKERERLMRPFRRSLVVKLMGRQPSYGFLVKKLRQIWARKGNIDILDLDNEFYLVSFQNHEDYMEALTGGLVAWVRFPDLPAPLFDKKFLLNLGNSIGRAIRLDIHTAQRARGKFARMCVELDLTKPLVPEFDVEGQVLSVVYESLGSLCKKCGRVGHTKEGCEAATKKRVEGDMDVEGVEIKTKNGNGSPEAKDL